MADDDEAAARLREHLRADLPCEGALRLPVNVLSPQSQTASLGSFAHLVKRRERRRQNDFHTAHPS